MVYFQLNLFLLTKSSTKGKGRIARLLSIVHKSLLVYLFIYSVTFNLKSATGVIHLQLLVPTTKP